MSTFVKRRAALVAYSQIVAEFREGDTMLDPKWGVIIVALGVFALAASYNATLGWVVGGTIVAIAAVYGWIRWRFAMDPGRIASDRSVLSRRLGLLSKNRQEALEREQRDRSDKN